MVLQVWLVCCLDGAINTVSTTLLKPLENIVMVVLHGSHLTCQCSLDCGNWLCAQLWPLGITKLCPWNVGCWIEASVVTLRQRYASTILFFICFLKKLIIQGKYIVDLPIDKDKFLSISYMYLNTSLIYKLII